jgi:hypothetical protein
VSGVFFSGRGVPAAAFAGGFRVPVLAAFTGAFALGAAGAACLPVDESEGVDEVSWGTGRFLAIYQCVFL